MFEGKQRRIALVYVLLQFVIWAKCIAFFVWFGHGKAADFSLADFPQNAVFLDWLFHEAMHVAIGILALSFGWNIVKIKWGKLWLVVFAAVAVHNVAYWFTVAHQGIAYSAVDFVSDSLLLMAFVLAGFVGKNFLLKHKKKGVE